MLETCVDCAKKRKFGNYRQKLRNFDVNVPKSGFSVPGFQLPIPGSRDSNADAEAPFLRICCENQLTFQEINIFTYISIKLRINIQIYLVC